MCEKACARAEIEQEQSIVLESKNGNKGTLRE